MIRTPSEPQQDRSRATRERLLQSALVSLADVGWTQTTVASVAERAGVSRGATQHHFPTREDLFGAAIEYMAHARLLEIQAALASMPDGPPRIRATLDLLVGLYTGPLFTAALQVWNAAAVDEAVRAHIIPLEQSVAREAFRFAAELLQVDRGNERLRAIVAATLDLGRGLGLADILTNDAERRSWILDAWAEELGRIIAAERTVEPT